MLMDYNLWSPLSSSKNAIVIEHVFTDVAVVFPKLSNDIVVGTCEFSKLQFPKSQIEAYFIRRSYVELSPCQMQFKQ